MQGWNRYNIRTPINCHVKLLKKSWRNKRVCSRYNAVAKWTLNRDFRQKISAVLTRCVTWPLHWVFIFFCFNAWIYGLQSNQYFQKSLHQSVRSDFGKKWHLTASVVGLQCLVRLLIIFSYYMKREKIFSRIFSKVESLQQQKGFTIWSREVTTKCFWQKKLAPHARSNKEPNNIDTNRNILGHLFWYSLKLNYKTEFEEVLKYPQAKILLLLCHADRTKSSNPKSDLLKALDIQYWPADVMQEY